MPSLKCPQCSRELAAGAQVCPWDGTPINSVVARPSLWNDERTVTKTKTNEQDPDSAPQSLPALLPGQKLGDYEVSSLLGQGGMGEVYAGEQPMIGKKVAIKVLKSEVAAEPGNVQRMLSEARSVNAIRHRSIVDIFNFGTLPDGRPYLVMEYLEGTALDAMLRKQGALIPAEVAEFLEEICSALAAAHARGIVHRDLKPGNVFIVSDGNTRNRYVKLLDFGLAKGEASGESSKQTRAGMVVGTPDYIAPEQARGGTITPRTDLYSLGVMAFEMLTGGLPFAADSVVELMMMHVATPAPRVRSKIDFCPPALDALVYQLMSKAPEDRPKSADFVRQDLARIRREMRESETMIGATLPMSAIKETIEIPAPEAYTPSATPFPEAREARTAPVTARPLRSAGPRTPPHVVVDPTARYASIQPREEKPGIKLWIPIAVVVALLAAVGAWFVTRPAPNDVIVLPPPPIVETPVVVEQRPPPQPKVMPQPKVAPVTTVDPVAKNPQVAPKPPRPKPPPAPVPPPVVASGPSKDDLRAELKRLLSRLERNKHAPKVVKQVDDTFSQRITDANTPEARATILKALVETP